MVPFDLISAGSCATASLFSFAAGTATEEVVSASGPPPAEPGDRPLQVPLVRGGEPVAGLPTLSASREHLRAALVTLHDPQLALNCCDRLLLLRNGCLLDALEPQQDSLEDMERKLSMVYGNLTLLRVNNKDGKPQLVLVR